MSPPFNVSARVRKPCRRRWAWLQATLLGVPMVILAAEATLAGWRLHLEQAYQSARQRYLADTNQVEAAWRFGRACALLAEWVATDTRRAALAREGESACRQALRRDAQSAPAHYFLAENLGQLARTRWLGALKLLEEMEAAYLSARRLDPALDHAGPDRSLGTLYLEAPRRPISLGDKAKAQHHLQQAVQLAPEFPGNRLMLLEAWVRRGEHDQARGQLPVVSNVLASARHQFTGLEWQGPWHQWERQWEQLQARLRAEPERRVAPRAR